MVGRNEEEVVEGIVVGGWPEESLNYRVQKYKWTYIFALFFLGVFNNNGYTTV